MQIQRMVALLLTLVVSLSGYAQRPNPDGQRLFVPVVVHAGGINSQFRSDVFVFNRGATFADVTLTFTPSGADGTTQFTSAQRVLAPGHLIAFEDIVATLFHTAGSGSLEISGDVESILARSTTYNLTSRGRVGQSVITVSADDATGIDEEPLLLMPIAENGRSRTNVGITETAGKAGVVRIRIGTGFFPGDAVEIPILPFSHQQVQVKTNAIFGAPGGSVKVIEGDARVVAYASVVDNFTGDPMYVAGKRSDTSRQVIPIAAHFNGPVWASELWYAHLEREPDFIFPLLLPLPPPPPPLLTFYPSHEPHAPRTHQPDVRILALYTNSALGAFFDFSDGGYGQIQFTPPENGFITTRLWAPVSNLDPGTVGQEIPPVPVSHAIGLDEWSDAIGIAMTPERRTNVGITEVTGAPVRVQVAFVNELGTAVGIREVDVAGHGNVQFSITAIASGRIDLARVRFTVIGGTGRILGYTSLIENASGDPTFILAE